MKLHRLTFVVLSLAATGGCVKRKLLIRSQPEGALVTIDKRPIGLTPVAVPYVYYGTREIQLEKDGFETLVIKQRIAPPWYEIPPLDFFVENFWPREVDDVRLLSFPLQPRASINEDSLLQRAGQLRGNVQRGTVPMPLVPSATAEPPSPVERR